MEKTLRKQLKALDIRPPLANNDINSILSLLSAHIKAKALTDEQQDACTPTQKEVEAYINTPDDAVAAKIRKEYPSSFKIIAASVLYGQKIAAAQLQAVLGELE